MQGNEALTELLLIVKLYVRLAQSSASIGHDLLRVKQVVEQSDTQQAGLDTLDLACQITDALCQMQRPSVELLGMSELLAAIDGATTQARACPVGLPSSYRKCGSGWLTTYA